MRRRNLEPFGPHSLHSYRMQFPQLGQETFSRAILESIFASRGAMPMSYPMQLSELEQRNMGRLSQARAEQGVAPGESPIDTRAQQIDDNRQSTQSRDVSLDIGSREQSTKSINIGQIGDQEVYIAFNHPCSENHTLIIIDSICCLALISFTGLTVIAADQEVILQQSFDMHLSSPHQTSFKHRVAHQGV
jgi:hypothetical protein